MQELYESSVAMQNRFCTVRRVLESSQTLVRAAYDAAVSSIPGFLDWVAVFRMENVNVDSKSFKN